ncbi:MAG TPA: hypothetical protein VIO94_16140 [Phenylobacterium sp.]
MTRNHLSGGEALGDQRGSNGTRAATVSHEFREEQKSSPTPQELEEAKARDLSNRLRGRYALGPIMANGEPEFGYRVFTELPGGQPFPAIYGEAADMIDALLAENEKLRASLLEAVGALKLAREICEDAQKDTYMDVSDEVFDKIDAALKSAQKAGLGLILPPPPEHQGGDDR